jgi:hypothetical protein
MSLETLIKEAAIEIGRSQSFKNTQNSSRTRGSWQYGTRFRDAGSDFAYDQQDEIESAIKKMHEKGKKPREIAGEIIRFMDEHAWNRKVKTTLASGFVKALNRIQEDKVKEPFITVLDILNKKKREWQYGKTKVRAASKKKRTTDKIEEYANKPELKNKLIPKSEIPFEFIRFEHAPAKGEKYSIVSVTGKNKRGWNNGRTKNRTLQAMTWVTSKTDPKEIAKMVRKKTKDRMLSTWHNIKIEVHTPNGFHEIGYHKRSRKPRSRA